MWEFAVRWAKFPFVKFINSRERIHAGGKVEKLKTFEKVQSNINWTKKREKMKNEKCIFTLWSKNVEKKLLAAAARANWIKTKLRIFPFYLFGSVARFLLSTFSTHILSLLSNSHFVQIEIGKGLTMMEHKSCACENTKKKCRPSGVENYRVEDQKRKLNVHK